MPTIKFSGLASGLDTAAIIQGMLQVERIPVRRLEARKAEAESTRRLFNDLATKARDLETLAQRLQDPANLAVRSASSTDEGVVTAMASSSASSGVHEVVVTTRAAATRLASQGYADSSAAGAVGSGTLSIQVGATTTDVTIDAGADSLEAVRDAINASEAGVTAMIVNDGSGTPYRLVVTGNETGLANAVTLDASGLSGGSQPLAFTTLASASDAVFEVDGIAMTRPGNVVTDALEGVSLELLQEDPGRTITVTVAVDAEESTAQAEELMEAVNGLLKTIRDKSQPGGEGVRGGRLLADFAASSAQRRLSRAIAAASGTGGSVNLAAIGITTERDGTLKVDADKVAEAFRADPEGVSGLLTDAATRLGGVARELGLSETGVFSARAAALGDSIRRLDRQIDRRELSLERLEESLTLRFTALEVLSSRLQSQAGFLAQISGGFGQ